MPPIYALVAQLDRVSDSDSEGRWFESSRAYHGACVFNRKCKRFLLILNYILYLIEIR